MRSIVSKSNWPLIINSNPLGAKIVITDKTGKAVYSGNTPALVKLKSETSYFVKQSYILKISMDGYETKNIPLECSLNAWYFGNLLLGGFLGMMVIDPLTGAMYSLDDEFINEMLVPLSSSNMPSLNIINIKDLTLEQKKHLVEIK